MCNKKAKQLERRTNMNYTFSDNISSVKPSAIREILKMVAANPSIISLSTGSPSSEAIPVDTIHEISEKIFRERGIESLQYSVTEGYLPLRETTKKRLHDVFGIDTENNDVIITTGGQQGLFMTPQVLVNRGDTVLVESPSFVSGIIAMKTAGANVVGVEMDEDGIRLDLLEQRMEEIGMKKEGLQWYLDLRRYGGCKHAGFGLGFERFVMYVTGMQNIRDVVPFARTPRNLMF